MLRGYYGWRIVGALGLTTIVSYGTSQYLFALLVEPVREAFGASRGTLGAAYAGSVLATGIAGIALGPALDRWGGRALLSAGSLVSAAALAALAHASDAGVFCVEWALGIGLGSALTYYPVSSTVVANWFNRDRPRALARLTFMSAFASTAVIALHVAFLTSRGYPLGEASGAVAFLGLAYIPGRWLFGRLAPVVPLQRLLAATIVLEAVAVAVLAGQRGVAWVGAYVIVFGIAYGAMAPLRGALIAALFGRRAFGTIIAAQGVAVALAGALGPFAVGTLADRVGYGGALWLAVGALALGAVVAAVPLPQTAS